jgi:hypothetical protein
MMRVLNARRSVALAAALASLLLGFVLGRYSARNAQLAQDYPGADARNSREPFGHPRAEREARSALASVRVEQLSHIPPSELAEVLEHRDAHEIAQLAKKFDILPPNPETYANLRPLFKTWAQFDEGSAFKIAVAFTDSRTREVAIETIAASASPDGAGRTAQSIREQSAGTFRDGIKEQLLDTALSNWSQTNPAAAADFVVENPELREISGSKILRNWGWIEGPAAVAWLNEHPSGSDYAAPRELSEAMLGWLEKDPPAASTYILDHVDDGKMIECLHDAASALFYVDKPLALQWPEKLPAGEIRETAILEIAKAYSETDPKEAAEWVVRLPSKTGMEAIESVMSHWAQKDSDAALAWINSRAGNLREEALVSFCRSLPGKSAGKAIEAANLITDPARRVQTIEAVVANTSDSALEQVRGGIQSSLLSPEQKAQLLAKIAAPFTR